MNPGDTVKIRLFNYKSLRHYGGREITATSHLFTAKLISVQSGHQPYIVELLESGPGYKAGRKIAISEIDFNVQ